MLQSAQFNKAQLQELLTIEDPQKETIYGVVGRMKVLLEFFKQHQEYHRLIPFLVTYYYVTKTSAGKYLSKANYFHNIRAYEVFDVYFATLYFRPLLKYLTEGAYVSPWSKYFHYTEQENGTPFLQMLLGINAHINTDLYSTLIDLDYKNQHDFFLVDDILQEVIPEVMHFLSFNEHDIVGITGMLFKDLTTIEFHTIIQRWRAEAWAHAWLITSKDREKIYEKIVQGTEGVATQLVANFSEIRRVYKASHILDAVNQLSVRI